MSHFAFRADDPDLLHTLRTLHDAIRTLQLQGMMAGDVGYESLWHLRGQASDANARRVGVWMAELGIASSAGDWLARVREAIKQFFNAVMRGERLPTNMDAFVPGPPSFRELTQIMESLREGITQAEAEPKPDESPEAGEPSVSPVAPEGAKENPDAIPKKGRGRILTTDPESDAKIATEWEQEHQAGRTRQNFVDVLEKREGNKIKLVADLARLLQRVQKRRIKSD